MIVQQAWTCHPGVISVAAIAAVEEATRIGDFGMAANVHVALAFVVKEDLPAVIQRNDAQETVIEADEFGAV